MEGCIVTLSILCYIFVGEESCKEEADDIDIQPSSLCGSPEESSYYGEGLSYPLELTDEYILDGEVGKRLNQMVPVPVSLATKKCCLYLLEMPSLVSLRKLLSFFLYACLEY